MALKKRKITIFLADLTHTGIRVATEGFPLNVGLIASYAMKKFGKDINVRLFKYPEKLLQALRSDPYDIVATSTYVWNNNLSEWACEVAKTINPNVLTVRGGWNFPLDEEQQVSYMRAHKHTDIFCMHEGELSFSAIIERLLGGLDTQRWADGPLDGSVYLDLDDKKTIIRGKLLPRIDSLDDIPSPYTTGLMDEFFDGNLTPIIETARGCPFECNYCNNSNVYYNKVNFFSKEYVESDIRYIADRVAVKGIKNLIISDTNFGMYLRDKEIALCLSEMREKYKWPLNIIVCTGKNDVKRILNNTSVLGNSLMISMSVQSMNPGTLKKIGRDRINIDMYRQLSAAMEKDGRSQYAELIVPLPEETYASYMDGVRKLLDMKVKRVISYTLQLNNGTVYKNKDYRNAFGYKGQFRLIPYDFGSYDGRKIFDYEEVATHSSTLSFKEYVEIRKFSLVMETLFSNSIFIQLFNLLKENEVNDFAFIQYVLEHLDDASSGVKKVFTSFVLETKNELKDSEDGLTKYYSNESNYKKLFLGEAGGNVIFKHKGIMLSRYLDEWAAYVLNCAKRILGLDKSAADKELALQLQEISAYVRAKLDGLFVPGKTHEVITGRFWYDIGSWLKSAGGSSLKTFKSTGSPYNYKFFYDNDQQGERDDLFDRYGSDVSGISKILARVPNLERMFRIAEKI